MNFRHKSWHDEPDINLIPLIDVLLVVLIFLAASTSFDRVRQLDIALPQAQADAADPQALNMAVNQDGLYALNGQTLADSDVSTLANALRLAHQSPQQGLLINADAQSPHQAVIRILEAARLAGVERIYFAVQDAP